MTRRQLPNECALFALCAYAQVDYIAASAAYVQQNGVTWGEHYWRKAWTQFTQQHLGLDVTEDFFANSNMSLAAHELWNQPRMLISVWMGDGNGSTHLAYAHADNIVEDGILSKPFDFAQYVGELGNRGGIIRGVLPVPHRLERLR